MLTMMANSLFFVPSSQFHGGSFLHSAADLARARILRSTTNDPAFNLATEDWLFSDPSFREARLLFLWRNSPTVCKNNNTLIAL